MNLSKLIDYIKIDKEEFIFQFQSHPHYPTALALSDTFNFLGLKNSAYELEKEYWHEIPSDFITIYDGEFALIQKDKDNVNYKILSSDATSVSYNELLEKSEEIIILLEDNAEIQTEKSSQPINIFIGISAVLILVISFLNSSWQIFLFNIFSSIGAYLSYEIFRGKFGNDSPVLSSICGKITVESSCSKIIKSDKLNIFGLKLSDFSLIYFLSILIIGVFGRYTSTLFAISFISIFAVLYSLYIQFFIEKKICKVCLTIITILVSQSLISFFSINLWIFSISGILDVFFTFLVVSTMLIIVNNLLERNAKLRKANVKHLRFKRNYSIFKTQLLNSDLIMFKNNHNSFFLGNQDTSLIHISLISNPLCGYCKNAHAILEELLKKYPEQISAQIRFNYTSSDHNKDIEKIITVFKKVYLKFGQEKFLEVSDIWFRNRNYKEIENYNNEIVEVNSQEELEIGHENLLAGYSFTPLFFINGYKFPDGYDRSDIFYFIDDLLEDQEDFNLHKAEAEKLVE